MPSYFLVETRYLASSNFVDNMDLVVSEQCITGTRLRRRNRTSLLNDASGTEVSKSSKF